MTPEPPPEPTRTRVRTRQIGKIDRTIEERHLGVPYDTKSAYETVPAEEIRNPAFVSLRGGMTIGLPNFNSVRVEVGISMPCFATEEDIRKTKASCARLVDEFLEEERQAALGGQEEAQPEIL